MTAGAICAHKDLYVGPTVVAMVMKFWLGVEIQSPTGLLSLLFCFILKANVSLYVALQQQLCLFFRQLVRKFLPLLSAASES